MRHWIGLLLALSLLVGCGKTPSEAYTDMTTAAQMGDREGFLSGFTERSRNLVGSLIGLSEAYGLLDSNPYELLVFDSIDDEQIDASGERAILEVRRGGSTRKILMIREDGAWKIDTQELETFWDSEGR